MAGYSDKILPQDVVVMFCEDERNINNLLYCESIDSFFIYQEDGYFKLYDNAELETIIFRYMLANYRKSISSNLVKDVIKMMRYFVYNKIDSNLNNYITLNNKKVLDTETFEIFNASPKIHSFHKIDCNEEFIKEYQEKKELPPTFKSFLDYVLVDKNGNTDFELISIVQEMFGYYLMSTLEAHASFFLVGSGGNGKSVMLGLLREMVGDDFSTSSTVEDLTTNQFAAASLVGKKINICDEDESKFVNSAKFKTLVTGDPITIVRKFQNHFTWKPTVKFIFSTNEMPTFTGFNKGLTRRMFIVPFNKEIPDEVKDSTLPKKLKREMQRILPWALEGGLRLRENGFKFSKSKQMQEQLEEFIKNISSTALFLMELYEPADYDFISSEMLYDSYKFWCDKKGKKPSNYYNFIKEAQRALDIKETEGNDGEGKIVKGLRIKIVDNIKQNKIEY
jgi:putative DNA primase/helicase